jgi:hypothetical protein
MPANAFLTTAAIGNREDLIDMIWNTAPTDTPLLSSIEKVAAEAVTHEWQRDTLATPANNAVAEGADAAYTAVTPTVRLSNQTQISRKTFSISDTQERVKTAGRKSDITYQKVKQGKELRKDMELACIENPTYTTGATRQTKGLRGFCVTNPGNNAGAPPAFPNTGPTDGTLRNFTEAVLRTAVLGAFANGGDVDMLMVAPAMKQSISTNWTGNGTKFIKGEDKKLQAAYDIYVSDFGDFKIVPNRVMQRTREAYLVDDSLVAIAVLRDMQTQELARIGSARNFMIESEYALEVREERGLAACRDIQAY